jgi:hypothetical protein
MNNEPFDRFRNYVTPQIYFQNETNISQFLIEVG